MLPVDATDLPIVPVNSGFPDETTLCDLIVDAKPGTVIVYHVGHLAFDRTLTAGVLPEWRRRELGAVANRTLLLAESGWVHLFQQRLDDGRCAYLIAVRPQPHNAMAALPPRLSRPPADGLSAGAVAVPSEPLSLAA